MNTDDRGQWTSASAAQADSLCPGRHLAQLGIPEPPPTEDAASGTRIHAALEVGNPEGLDGDEIDVYEKCVQIGGKIFYDLFGYEHSELLPIKEQRLWLEFDGLKHSGKADVFYILGQVALICDFKTGRNEAPDSPRNLQLRDLAVLVAVNYGVSKVHVAIIQPWVTMTPEVCTYELTELLESKWQLQERVRKSNDPKSPRVPGEVQCQYCRAKGVCPEFQAVSLPVPAVEATPETVKAGIVTLPGERLGVFLSLVRLASDTAEAEVRSRLNAGTEVPGWELKPGRTTEKIIDAQTVFSRALKAGVTQETFVKDCVSVTKGKLKDALKAATGTKGKALDAELDALLAGATETKTSDPILTKV